MKNVWILAALLTLTACLNHDTVDGPVEMTYTDIVTFEGNEDTGARFSYLPQGDAPDVVLQADRALDPEKFTAGERVLISYVPQQGQGISGAVALKGVAQINGGPVRILAPEAIPAWDRDPIYVEALWRTGHYINLRARIPIAAEPRVYDLIVDKATVSTGVAELYLAHILAGDTDRDKTYPVTSYASFDMGGLWERADVRSVRVHVANTNLTSQTLFVFNK